ncbi:uncharacterized protein LOC131311775 isoform X1 [Rhododendron vialii]|uniref:uncharacterized protein LOC131311775 isoform X1 n=1 Tax=Rhododendron vialii TaxID=182163 RepID=UPI00265FA677|nr:uncharacterized protein LOC131311775 isoform X1 [Rhododendron vialii]
MSFDLIIVRLPFRSCPPDLLFTLFLVKDASPRPVSGLVPTFGYNIVGLSQVSLNEGSNITYLFVTLRFLQKNNAGVADTSPVKPLVGMLHSDSGNWGFLERVKRFQEVKEKNQTSLDACAWFHTIAIRRHFLRFGMVGGQEEIVGLL